MRSRSNEIAPIEIPTGRITAITPSPRTPGRFELAIDGTPVTRLSIDDLERLRLQIGQTIGGTESAQIAREAQVTRAYDRAMAMLAARGRASGELRRLLVQKGEVASVADIALARLQAAGFLDDAAFARQFARYRAVNLGLSRRRIQSELTRRGIDRVTAAAAIAETFVDEGVNEVAALESTAEKKLRSMARLDVPTRRRRLYAFLARRGHDPDAIAQVVRQLTKEAVAED
jgi:regulatory protein